VDEAPAQERPDGAQDREAAAVLAEMATALAAASATAPTGEDHPEAEDDSGPADGGADPSEADGAPLTAGAGPEGTEAATAGRTGGDGQGRRRRLTAGGLSFLRRWARRPVSATRRPRLPARPPLGPRAARALRGMAVTALGISLLVGLGGGAPLPEVGAPGPVRPVSAAASPSPAVVVVASGSPAAGPSATATAPASSPFAEETPLVAPPQSAPTAAITFNSLMLDSSLDPTGSARTFSFISDGGGVVSAQVVATSAMDATKLCLAVDASPIVCQSGATPDITETTTSDHSRWTVTLISANGSQPTVDVAFSWPTGHPAITLTGGRFQGYPNPDPLRSLTATFTTRASGDLSLGAAWSPVTVDATLTLSHVAGAQAAVVDTVEYRGRQAISSPYAHALARGATYRAELYDDSPDFPRIDLTAEIQFP
jgi:hypothetical protein